MIKLDKKDFKQVIKNARLASKKDGYNRYVYHNINEEGDISFSRCYEKTDNTILLAIVETYWDYGTLKTKTINVYNSNVKIEDTNSNKSIIYVTFYIDYIVYGRRHFAICCDTMQQAKEAASDIYSIDGVKNIRINKCGRLPKNTVVSIFGSHYYIKP